MKNILIFFALGICTLGVRAQTDTLDQFWKQAADTGIIVSPNGGWVSGTNGYGDREKHQAFFNTRTYSVLGAIVWIARLDTPSGNPENSRTWLKLKRLDITTTTTAPFIRGPRETIDSVAFPLSTLQAGDSPETGFNWLPFPTPVLVNQPYTMGLTVFEEIQNDTLALMHSEPDSVSAAGRSWELYNGRFRRMIDSWGLNIDFAIFPVIDTTLNATNSPASAFDLTLFPNPTQSVLHLTGFPDSSNDAYDVSLYSADGRHLRNQKLQHNSGTLTLSVDDLTPGIYLIKLSNGKAWGVKPFIIHR
jgi:hypothetical protein